MARCPFAIWRPLPQNASAPKITARVALYHTMVGTLAGVDGYFRSGRSSGIESHFGVGCPRCVTDGVTSVDGEVWQWMDTDRRADANYHANGFAISVETCDHFRGLTYTNPPLSPGQVQAWIKLGLWAAEVHGIPRRRVPEWDSSGFGYHSMFGAPSHYTPAAGKTCPNPTRIRQFNEQVLPAIVAGKEGDWFSMADVNDLKAAVRAVLNDESIATEPKAGSIASKIKDIQADGDQTRLDLSKTGDRIGADILRRVSNSDEIQADLAILAANVSELQAAVAAIKAMLVGPPA